jgi:cell division transport system permease protein
MYKAFTQIADKYQNNITNNYSIIVVSTKKIDKLNIYDIDKITQINVSKQIEKMKKRFKNIDFKKIHMPYFYKIKLNHLPSPNRLKEIEYTLNSLPYIKRVLTYQSSQTKIYNLLLLIKIITNSFMIISTIIGFMLIIKQLEVWKLEHNERMYIMELFGAPFWFRGLALFKIAIIDSIISINITLVTIGLITHLNIFETIIKDLNINFEVDYLNEVGFLSLVCLAISVFSSIMVVRSKKELNTPL